MISNQCISCRHIIIGDPDKPAACRAFPAGIPNEILTGRVSHLDPIEGDHGIQWSPYPGREE